MVEALAGLFASLRILDVVLAVMAVELAVLAVLGRRRGAALHTWLPMLGAGAALVIAWRLWASGAAWYWTAALLAAAGLAHLVDLRARWRR